MAFLAGPSQPPTFPSGRYKHTNPLRRLAGLRVLTEPLPEPLRRAIRRAWRWPGYFEVGMTALPSPHRQRPGAAEVAFAHPGRILLLAQVEMEVSRRVVEAPRVSLTPAERDSLLTQQGRYLHLLYVSLARQIGDAAALAEFERLLLRVG
jgi:hypothetical protein